ncbi:MAG: glycosyltransferase [Cetobacterium sp.]
MCYKKVLKSKIEKELTFIVVDYNTFEFIEKLCNSIKKFITKIDYRILIITNVETNSWLNLKKFSTENNEIEVLVQQKNTGFGISNNLGLTNTSSEYICFINPDIEFIENMDIFFKESMQELEENSDVGIISPNLLNLDNTQQVFWGKLPGSLRKRKDYYSKYTNIKYIEYSWIIGAFYLVKRKKIPNKIPFDENIFMYAEDLDLCLRYRKEKLKILVNNKYNVIHYGGSSLKEIPEDKRFYKKYHLERESLFYVLVKNYSYKYAKHYFNKRLIVNMFLGYLFCIERRRKICKIYLDILKKNLK